MNEAVNINFFVVNFFKRKAIEIETFAVQEAPIQTVYLLLITQSNARGVKSSAHSTFPMQDINQCEKEGKRWKSTAIDGINGKDKSYYCVKGSK